MNVVTRREAILKISSFLEEISGIEFKYYVAMEEDRRQTDLGTAADIEEAQLTQASPSPAIENETEPSAQNGSTPLKQPKKRFVGRRAATEAAAKNGVSGASGESGAVQSMWNPLHDA